MSLQHRFMSTTEDAGAIRSPSFSGLRSFYSGNFVADRMDAVRRYIVYIRHHWDRRHEFALKLIAFMAQKEIACEELNKCLAQKTDWAESAESVVESSDYSILKIYTSEDGFNNIFRVINSIFRQDDAISEDESVLCAVYLVERINIALFNYVLVQPERTNYQGILYRGMSVGERDFEAYSKLREVRIPDRYISVPLYLWSASSARDIATRFIAKAAADNSQGSKDTIQKSLLMKIYVIGLPEEYLSFYRQRFPQSVVSTICAVDIDDISINSGECEVLLRGPFFQVLDLKRSLEGNWMTLEVMMLNTNRDHVTTAFLGKDDQPARQLIGSMIKVTRYRFAVEYYMKKEMYEDASDYREELKKAEVLLEDIMNQPADST